MKCPTENRLIQVYLSIPDFYIVATIRIAAYPSFVVNRCSLPEIGKGQQYTIATLLTFRKRIIFQRSSSHPKKFPDSTP